MPTETESTTRTTRTFKLDSSTFDQVVDAIKKLVREGSIRKIVIKDSGGKTFAEFPLGVGVIVAALLPVYAAIATIAALAADYSLEVELEEGAGKGQG